MISKGCCVVDIYDGEYIYDVKKRPDLPVLGEGEIFGEISLVYGCKRSATISSSSFVNLAVLTHTKYKEALLEFPFLTDILKHNIFKYKDKQKTFMQKCLNKIPYFMDISMDAQHDVMYNMVASDFYQDEILIRRGKDATSLFFLAMGELAVYTETDKRFFCLEKLYKGSIINYRTFFMTYNNMVTLKFEKFSILFELSYT